MLGQNLKVDPEHKKMRDKFKRLLFLVVFLGSRQENAE